MKCTICEIGCRLEAGDHGRCGMVEIRDGAVAERLPNAYITAAPISIETMPMTHFRPRAKVLQIGGVGCNFSCKGCVSGLFTADAHRFASAIKRLEPDTIVDKAKALGCEGIVCCMNDPVVNHRSFLGLAEKARAGGLLVGCSSNTYHTTESISQLAEAIDFINCGVKGGTDRAYRQCGAPSVEPVFRNIRILHQAGIHVEVSLMYASGNESEVMTAAERLADISRDMPLQIMRFLPFGDASIHSEPTVQAAEDLCRRVREILPYTYLFNTPGTPYLHTTCPRCGALLMYREFFGPMGSRMIASAPEGRCPCGHRVPIKGPVRKKAYEEFGMSGGYRYTRGLEIIKSLCECLGIVSDEEIDRVWCSVVEQDDVGKLHDKINRVDTYLALITEMGQRFGKEARASTLTDYMAERIGAVATAVRGGSRPSVYYAMGTPLFALNAERFEVHLVELAGGYCVNTNITRSGKPGVNLSREELLDMNPEHIFISGLFSSAEEAFRETCSKNGIWVDAVRDHRIHAVSPGWDFGNPRWILGLMQIANILHPETSTFDLAAETERFYRVFHHSAPDRFISNRSFYQQPMPSQREPGHGPAPSEGVPA